jgi:hypothetical protein
MSFLLTDMKVQLVLSAQTAAIDISLKTAQTNEEAVLMIVALLNLDASHQYLLYHTNSASYIPERTTMGEAGVRDGVC